MVDRDPELAPDAAPDREIAANTQDSTVKLGVSRLTEQRGELADEGLFLWVVGESIGATYRLPPGLQLVIGRGSSVDIRIDAPSISRQHARLYTGTPCSITDLGSANGTRIGPVILPSGKSSAIVPGQTIALGSVLMTLLENGSPARDGAQAEPAPAGIVIHDPRMEQLHELVERVARSSISALILGETGVGKEVVAETIHRRSPRADKPFLRLNCGAFSESLLESEIFGHEKGAFTGAMQTKMGLIESADGGTVFLDEIGEMPAALQVKLLRVLEERTIMRVGALRPRPVDIRILAATHRDLQQEIARGAFRQDLFFRLNGISLTIPPLRERVSEIEPLARLFLARACQRASRRAVPRLPEETLAVLRAHRYPGNIRELRNVVERALLLCDGDTILPTHIQLEQVTPYAREDGAPAPLTMPPPPASSPGIPAAPPTLRFAEGPASADELEHRRIIEALERCAGNQTRAARLLGMARGTLASRLALYGIPRPRGRT